MGEIDYPSTLEDRSPGEPKPTDKEYVEIIKSTVDIENKDAVKDPGVPATIVYYCPKCEKLVKPNRPTKKLRFTCSECKTDVAWGTEKSIQSYFKIKTEDKQLA